MKETTEKAVYTVAEIQVILGIGRRQVYNLIHEGRFPHKRLGKTIVIPVKEFDSWLHDGNIYSTFSRYE